MTADTGLVEDLLIEAADWKELAKIDAKADLDALAAGRAGARRLARIMLYRHLGGEKQACDLAAAVAAKALKAREFDDDKLLEALIVNDRIDQAVEAVASRRPSAAFGLLAAQNRMREAFRLVKIDVPLPAKIDWRAWLPDGKGEVTQERRWLAHQVLRALRLAGENEQAEALLGTLVAMVAEKLPDRQWQAEAMFLMDADVSGGPPESRDALAAKLLALDLESPERVIAGAPSGPRHDCRAPLERRSANSSPPRTGPPRCGTCGES